MPPPRGPQIAPDPSGAAATPPQLSASFQNAATFSGLAQSTVTHVISTVSMVIADRSPVNVTREGARLGCEHCSSSRQPRPYGVVVGRRRGLDGEFMCACD